MGTSVFDDQNDAAPDVLPYAAKDHDNASKSGDCMEPPRPQRLSTDAGAPLSMNSEEEFSNNEHIGPSMALSMPNDWLSSSLLRVSLDESDDIHARTVCQPHTGHMHNLTADQREKMYHIYGMLIEYVLGDVSCAKMSPNGKEVPQVQRIQAAQSLLRKVRSASFRREVFELTDDEKHKIECSCVWEEFSVQMATDDPDSTILRFLRARKWAVADAFLMLVDSLEWRAKFKIQELLSAGEARVGLSPLIVGKNFFWKTDRQGNLVCYVRSRLHDRNAQPVESSMDHTIYSVEVGRRLRTNDEQLVTIVFDLEGAGMASMDLGILQFMIGCFQSYYPEILGLCLIKDAPWIFWGFWTLLKPLLDPIVAAKIHFVTADTMADFIPPENMPRAYGGSDPYEYRFVQPPVRAVERAQAVGKAMLKRGKNKGHPEVSDSCTVTRTQASWRFSSKTSRVQTTKGVVSVSETCVAMGAVAIEESTASTPDERDAVERETSARLHELDERILPVLSTFVSLTREMHGIITRVQEGADTEVHVRALQPARDKIKAALRQCYRERDELLNAETYYHRVSVLDGSGVQWHNYSQPSVSSDS